MKYSSSWVGADICCRVSTIDRAAANSHSNLLEEHDLATDSLVPKAESHDVLLLCKLMSAANE
jgi:hypothetical protein